MNTGFSLFVALLLSLFHHGNLSTSALTVAADVTPSVTPTDTIVPTVTPTDTPTPSVTITPSVTPTGDGDKDDMLGLHADVHALFGLMNAAFHHEQNEQRFEDKHGSSPDSK